MLTISPLPPTPPEALIDPIPPVLEASAAGEENPVVEMVPEHVTTVVPGVDVSVVQAACADVGTRVMASASTAVPLMSEARSLEARGVRFVPLEFVIVVARERALPASIIAKVPHSMLALTTQHCGRRSSLQRSDTPRSE